MKGLVVVVSQVVSVNNAELRPMGLLSKKESVRVARHMRAVATRNVKIIKKWALPDVYIPRLKRQVGCASNDR